LKKKKAKATTKAKKSPQKKSPVIKGGKADEPTKTNTNPQRNRRKSVEKNKVV
jgi:hypothetical protein